MAGGAQGSALRGWWPPSLVRLAATITVLVVARGAPASDAAAPSASSQEGSGAPREDGAALPPEAAGALKHSADSDEALRLFQRRSTLLQTAASFVAAATATGEGSKAFLQPAASAANHASLVAAQRDGAAARSLLEADPDSNAPAGFEPYPTGPWGFDISGMDAALKPGDDWYHWANGKWLQETTIPSDQSSWSAFGILGQQTLYQVHGILEKGAQEGSRPGRYYKSFMNVTRIEALGQAPLRPLLEKVTNLRDLSEFASMAGATNYGFGRSPFGFYIGADAKDPEMNIAHLSQSGLGLPSRDYYLRPQFAKQKEAYGQYIVKMLSMVDWPDAEGLGAKVLAFEESIAEVSWPRESLRDPVKTYNKMTVGDLSDKAPGFDWPAFMRGAGNIPADTPLVVSAFNGTTPDGVVGIAKLIGNTDLSVLQAWEAFHTVSGAANYLPRAFVEAKFNFFSKTLGGQKVQKPRWKRAVSSSNSMLGDDVGKAYVAQYFPTSSKTTMDVLTGLLKEAYASRIKKLDWMGDKTKEKALAKLDSFTFEIGYPKKWREYRGLVIKEDDLFGNVERGIADSWQFDLNQLGKPVDHDYWGMPPQVVNAFFDPTQNKCVFLAAILQPPFFDPHGDMSVNFGGIGAVIGHEMTHGFDDSGRKYDAKGKLDDWWTPEDALEFSKRAHAYGEQFWNFTEGLPPGMHIRPGLTMGENIADLGGLTIALEAYHLWLQKHQYTPIGPFLEPDTDGLEGERRLFAGWAQVWRAKYTMGALQQRLTSDPHSPGPARATIPPRNLDEWYRAFKVNKEETLYIEPSKRIQIW